MKARREIPGGALRRLWLLRNRSAFCDSGADRKPRLLVDVSVIAKHDAATGIQRVVRSVWSHLIELETREFDVVPVHAGKTYGYCFAPTDFLSHRPRHAGRVPVGVRPGDKFLGLDLAAHYLPNYAAQLAAWRAHGASVHFVVYDLLPLSRPDWFKPATSQHFARWLQSVTSHADQGLCISDSVAQEFRRRTIGTAANGLAIGRLHLSGDIAGSIPSAGLSPRVKLALDRARSHPVVLMVGTIEPRKGYDRALDAFERLWEIGGQDAPDLVIIGKAGWKMEALQQRIRSHAEYGRRLHWLDDVSDEALTNFYQTCRAVFLASYDEGFGLPAVEAATHHRWALVRDIPVFREQNLPNLRYFEDDRPDALAAELAVLVEKAEAAQPPMSSPPKWSWCVDRLLEEIGFARDDNAGQAGTQATSSLVTAYPPESFIK